MNKAALNQALSKSIRTKYMLSKVGVARFKNFQHWLLDAELAPEIHLLLCLFAFDGMRVGDFKLAMQSCPVCYEADKIGLGWVDENRRQQRIKLGKISLKLLANLDWEKVQGLTLNTLANYYAYFCGIESPLEKFSSDQLAWFCEIASGPLVEHFAGRIPMTALSDACYARLSTNNALYLDSKISDEDGILYQCLQGWLEPKGGDKNPIYIDRIVQICRRGRIDNRHGYKSQLLKQCQDVLQEATDAGPVTSLILSWAVNLILNGTAAQSDIAVSTIVNYVGVLAKLIFIAFSHKNFEEWNVDKFELIYSMMIIEASPGQKRNIASAINSWHRFIVSWLDVPPLNKRMHDDVPVSVPSANVLWAHEYEQIQHWLSNATMEKRLTMYLKAMFNIAFRIRIRINELLKLRLSDVHLFGELAQINIRGTKSTAAKRRIEINVIDCKDFMDLVQYRQSEMALLDDYLFADPNRVGRIFQLSKLYTCASHLIKAVTGDPSTRFHIQSHSIISAILKDQLLGNLDNLTNPLHQLATDFGHYSILTSCSEYMHRYEDAIRASIDRGLSRLEISSEIAAIWSGKKPTAIRKYVSRCNKDKNLVYWEAILAASHAHKVNDVCHGLQLSNPILPRFLNENHSIGVRAVLSVFSDIQKGIPIDIVALRQSFSTDVIRGLLSSAKKVFIKSLEGGVNFKSSTEQVIKVLVDVQWRLNIQHVTALNYDNP